VTSLRVLIADGYAPTRAGLRITVSAAGHDPCCVVATRPEAATSAREHRPDVALVAADLPDGGIDAVREVKEHSPGTAVVVLTGRLDEDELLAAVLAGATGYVGKDIAVDRVPAIVSAVADGEVALPRALTGRVLFELRGRDRLQALVDRRAKAPLTAREWEILRLLGADASTAVMALKLGISEVTVRRHVSGLLTKLGVPDRAAASRLLRSDD
jgi:DNA-binding NarL/FixJ family response regulator